MLTFNSKILSFSAFAIIVYFIFTSVHIKGHSSSHQQSIPLSNTEQRIKEIRAEASGKEKIAIEEDITWKEQMVYSIIDYIAGEDFRKQFINHV